MQQKNGRDTEMRSNSAKSTPNKQKEGRGGAGGDNNTKVMYEESILMTLLGPEYVQFISEETGEWVHE